jgi:phosphoenolpyruvate synthase/pyruvate phosphate dikinase
MFSRSRPRDKQSLVVSLETVQRSDILLDGGKAVRLKQSDSGALVRKAFEAAPLPSELVQAIEIAYHRLGACPVAVRSSTQCLSRASGFCPC